MKKNWLVAFLLVTFTMLATFADEYKGFKYQFHGDEVTIIWYYGTEVDVIFPSHINGKPVTRIGIGTADHYLDKSLDNRDAIQSIYIPNTVKEISDYAFSDMANLQTVFLPDGLEKIGEGVFLRTPNLQTVVLPDGLEEISKSLFYKSGIKYVTIPNSVKYIRNGAFEESDIEYIILPDSIVGIEEEAFKKSKLKEIMISQKVKSIIFKNFWGNPSYDPFLDCLLLSETSRARLREVGYDRSF